MTSIVMCRFGGAAPHQIVERRLDGALAFGVQRAGRFVEQQDRRILQDGAGYGEPLALAAGQLHAEIADRRCRTVAASA